MQSLKKYRLLHLVLQAGLMTAGKLKAGRELLSLLTESLKHLGLLFERVELCLMLLGLGWLELLFVSVSQPN